MTPSLVRTARRGSAHHHQVVSALQHSIATVRQRTCREIERREEGLAKIDDMKVTSRERCVCAERKSKKKMTRERQTWRKREKERKKERERKKTNQNSLFVFVFVHSHLFKSGRGRALSADQNRGAPIAVRSSQSRAQPSAVGVQQLGAARVEGAATTTADAG